jgi:hypothetical protein
MENGVAWDGLQPGCWGLWRLWRRGLQPDCRSLWDLIALFFIDLLVGKCIFGSCDVFVESKCKSKPNPNSSLNLNPSGTPILKYEIWNMKFDIKMLNMNTESEICKKVGRGWSFIKVLRELPVNGGHAVDEQLSVAVKLPVNRSHAVDEQSHFHVVMQLFLKFFIARLFAIEASHRNKFVFLKSKPRVGAHCN